jgi:hypothetical protein
MESSTPRSVSAIQRAIKEEKLRPTTGVIVRNLKFLFVDTPMSWWESTESENYCARCEHLIEFDFGWRSSPNVTPQSANYWHPTSARCACADSQEVRLREVSAATKMMRRMGCIRITNFRSSGKHWRRFLAYPNCPKNNRLTAFSSKNVFSTARR